eukprot:comp23006_c0_seq1/m.36687 comp23006_c0_seq1/g.36687  ORF comp23006_c0_seq1/g.36687 comp23006_c0_seq1/m.36687 type:complete len:1736 (-) comp23006_c0_seq1:41-5248(-)
MAISRMQQLGLLLWKNYKIQLRRKIGTAVELLLPLAFCFMVVALKGLVQNSKYDAKFQNTDYAFDQLPWPNVTTIYFSPNGTQADQVMAQVAARSGNITNVVGIPASQMAILGEGKIPFAGVEFNLTGATFANDLSFSLRFPYNPYCNSEDPIDVEAFCGSPEAKSRWETEVVYAGDFFQKGPKVSDNNLTNDVYYLSGFGRLQYEVSRALINLKTTGNAAQDAPIFSQLSSFIQLFPYAEYAVNDYATFGVKFTCSLVVTLAFLYPVVAIVRDIVMEKELRLKEAMRMMGLSTSVYWLGWFVKAFSMHILSMILFGVLLKAFGVIEYVNIGIVIVFLILYLIAIISFAFMVSTWFSSAKVAAAVSGILFFVTYIPYQLLQVRYKEMNSGVLTAACLAVNTCMSWGWTEIGSWEEVVTPMNWSDLGKPSVFNDPLNMGLVYGMLIVDSVLFLTIGWYVENVFPGKYGVSKPWYFFATRAYWCGTTPKDMNERLTANTNSLGSDEAVADKVAAKIEPDPEDMTAGVQIKGLTKRYDNGKLALHGLDLNMYEGQITCLLGHNGAGKTTAMSLLTGLYEPTSGTAYINGHSIITDMDKCRESLGLCPQVNTLFASLTVKEQLLFFGRLKGIPSDQIESEIETMLQDLEMAEKVESFPSGLSGGMKRKLCVGIALIGGSKVVFLDEPTSGMDPSARRATWELITKYKPGRTILLTTHFMDEADLLGNRIAIMAEGRLRACGSSMYLKRNYGVGYQLVMVKGPGCDPNRAARLVKEHVPDARLLNNVGTELSFQLPTASAGAFEGLFDALDRQKTELAIPSYGVSCTTLEEVFLKVGENMDVDAVGDVIETAAVHLHDAHSKKLPLGVSESMSNDADPNVSVEMLEHGLPGYVSEHDNLMAPGPRLWMQRFQALFLKRLINSKRDWKVASAQLILPVIFVILAMVVAKAASPVGNTAQGDPPRLFTPTDYYQPNMPWSNAVTTPAMNSTASSIAAQLQALPYGQNISPNPDMLNYLLAQHRALRQQFLIETVGAISMTNLGANRINGTVWYSGEGRHAFGVFSAVYFQALLRASTGNNALVMNVTNRPFPREATLELTNSILGDTTGNNVAINAVFGFGFLYASFVIFVIKERVSKAKHIQFVSGVTPLTYWLAAFAWDFLNTLIPIFLCMIVFAAFNTPAYTGDGRLGLVLLLCILFSWGYIPLMYLIARFFAIPATGFSAVIVLNLLTGLGTLIAVNIIRLLGQDKPENYEIAKTCTYAFYIFPNFAFGIGLGDIFSNWQLQEGCKILVAKFIPQLIATGLLPPGSEKTSGSWCTSDPGIPVISQFTTQFPNPAYHMQYSYISLQAPGIGGSLLALFISGCVFFSLVLLLENRFFIPQKAGKYKGRQEDVEEDEDVVAEAKRIHSGGGDSDIVKIVDLSKVYPKKSRKQKSKVAVDGLTFGIQTNECFGLLGVNGAGKTTTFNMMTGDHPPSSGNVWVAGHSILTDIGDVRQQIGYCPQFDALVDTLTGRETLEMYARLRGVRPDRLREVVDNMVVRMDLTAHADRLCGTYSGGNKRKLSTAMALIGDPPVVFLDEPTTGVDPATRRFLWDILATITKQGRCVVLTSHSMEECEALCTRLTIMVSGRLRCLGSIQHLKARYGQGYTVSVKVAPHQDTAPVKEYVQETFSGAVLKEEHQGLLTYALPKEGVTLGQVFGALERARGRLGLDDYSLSQTTLEQIFILFARQQEMDEAKHHE